MLTKYFEWLKWQGLVAGRHPIPVVAIGAGSFAYLSMQKDGSIGRAVQFAILGGALPVALAVAVFVTCANAGDPDCSLQY